MSVALSMCRRAILILCLVAPLVACSTAREDDPNSPAAPMTTIAATIAGRGDWAGAETFYRKAVERDPSYIPPHLALAEMAEKYGNLNEAAAEYHAALAQDPHRDGTQCAYGRVLLQLDRADEARDAFQAALDQDSDDVRAMNGLAVAYGRLDQKDKALELYHDALDTAPDNMTTLNNYAYALILAGQQNKAIEILEPHWNAANATPALRQNLALAYGLAGMEADAGRMAQMDLSPKDVAANMAFYRQKRAETVGKEAAASCADVGPFATQAMAEARMGRLKTLLDKVASDDAFKPVIMPQVETSGGTPRFVIRIGCSDAMDTVCKALRSHGMTCQAGKP